MFQNNVLIKVNNDHAEHHKQLISLVAHPPPLALCECVYVCVCVCVCVCTCVPPCARNDSVHPCGFRTFHLLSCDFNFLDELISCANVTRSTYSIL